MTPLPSRSLGWQLGLSAYWFAISLKWFVLLTAILPGQVRDLVPGGEEGTYWGQVVMLGAIWAMFGPAIFGYLSDRTRSRFGKWKPFVAVGSGLTVVALMILSNPQHYWVIIAGYLLLQISDDIGQGPYSALIPALVPETERGRASGVMALLQMLAQFVGGVGAFALFSFTEGVGPIYIFIAVVNVICALITLTVVRDSPEPRATTGDSFIAGWIEPWLSPDFRWVWFTRFLNALGFYLIYTYMLFYLTDSVKEFQLFGFPIASAAGSSQRELQQAAQQASFILILLISLIAGLSALNAGKLSDRVGRKKTIYLSGTLMAVVVPPFALFPNFTLIFFLAILFGIGYGAFQSADWALASDIMPNRDDLAKDMGLWQSSVASTQIFSGAAGRLVDYGNSLTPGYGYVFTFLFASVAFLLSTVLIRKVRGST